MITRDDFSKLLQGSGSGRMGRDIAVQNAATSDFHKYDHVQHSEASRDGYQEVSGHDGLGVIANERPPVLRSCSPTASRIPILRPVGPHRSWRNQDSELHLKFGCDALLTPCRVLLHHTQNESVRASSSLARTCSDDM